MSNKLMKILLVAAVLLMLGGCGIPSMPSDLITAPYAVDDRYSGGDGMHTSLLALLPDGARLLTMPDGKPNNGISYGDLDGDGQNEAIVVYEQDDGRERTLKAALLMRRQEVWQIVWHGEGSGHGLDYAGIYDVDRDGAVEILLGWSLGAGVNGLDIYEWDKGTLKLQDRKGYHENIDLKEMTN
ncbi:hypothetical protein YSY43_08870 [Paenibacillus sp. YSY-4.3]